MVEIYLKLPLNKLFLAFRLKCLIHMVRLINYKDSSLKISFWVFVILMCSGDVIGLILSIINLFSLILTFANSKDVTVLSEQLIHIFWACYVVLWLFLYQAKCIDIFLIQYMSLKILLVKIIFTTPPWETNTSSLWFYALLWASFVIDSETVNITVLN